jgi:hypothetical protein
MLLAEISETISHARTRARRAAGIGQTFGRHRARARAQHLTEGFSHASHARARVRAA